MSRFQAWDFIARAILADGLPEPSCVDLHDTVHHGPGVIPTAILHVDDPAAFRAWADYLGLRRRFAGQVPVHTDHTGAQYVHDQAESGYGYAPDYVPVYGWNFRIYGRRTIADPGADASAIGAADAVALIDDDPLGVHYSRDYGDADPTAGAPLPPGVGGFHAGTRWPGAPIGGPADATAVLPVSPALPSDATVVLPRPQLVPVIAGRS